MALLLFVAPTESAAQEVRERADVRALEVLVAIDPASRSPLRRSAPPGLAVNEFEASLDGERVGVLEVTGSFEEATAEPWQVLVYIDVALSPRTLVRDAAGLLAGAAGELTGLGEVEIVLADPEPRLLLAATRDAEAVDRTLSGVALDPPGDDLLVAQRAEWIREADPDGRLARVGVAWEIQQVRRQADRLLTWLDAAAGPSPRRALLLANGGFDLEPEAFYGAPAIAVSVEQPPLAELATDVARAVAAGQWVTFALRSPEPDPLPRRWGLRRSLLVRLDGNWDPKRAEAYAELGESLIRQEKWKRAEEALESAAYHFYSQPKLRRRQAEVLLRLAYVLERQGRTLEADKVAGKAVELDPSRASTVSLAGLLDPVPAMAHLAEAGAGGLVSDGEGLREALAGLARRVRLVLQTDRPSGREPAALGVTYARPGFDALAPGWVWMGTPEVLAAARVRRLLDESVELEPASGELLSPATLHARCAFRDAPATRPETALADLDVRVDPGLGPEWEGLTTRLRLSAAGWAGEIIETVQVVSPETEWTPGREIALRAELALAADEPTVAVGIEEMTTGRWFASFVRCEDPLDGGGSAEG